MLPGPAMSRKPETAKRAWLARLRGLLARRNRVYPAAVPVALVEPPLEPRTCPYCLSRFEQAPLHDLDCAACGERVFVMRDRETGGRLLLTKEQAEALREEDASLLGPGALLPRERWLRELEESHGVLRADFERERRTLGAVDDQAVIWRLLDLLAEQKKDYGELVDLYERRARFADECGLDSTSELRRARALELLAFKKEGDVEYVRIRGSGCPACARADGVRLPLERAMHGMPLPVADCTCPAPHSGAPFCTCRYERDARN
jgi:hypothetical protein